MFLSYVSAPCYSGRAPQAQRPASCWMNAWSTASTSSTAQKCTIHFEGDDALGNQCPEAISVLRHRHVVDLCISPMMHMHDR